MNSPDSPFLTSTAPVPIDRPFTSAWARAQGVDRRCLRTWLMSGHLVSPVHGVMYAAQLRDSMELRIACLRLVVPEHAVVTDRTAAWVHGAPMVLEPNAHLHVPRVDLFLLPGGRIRRGVVRSGQRELFTSEIEEVGGLRVTTRARTMCDLGMQLPRRQAFAAMCSLLKVGGFTLDDIRQQADGRFKGHRWVRQLRGWFPCVMPASSLPVSATWRSSGTTHRGSRHSSRSSGWTARTGSSTSISLCPTCSLPPSTTAWSSTDPSKSRLTRPVAPG